MLLTDMFQRAMIESGQFQIPVGTIELSQENFAVLVYRCLGVYNKHVPIDTWLYVNASGGRSYEFDLTNTPTGIPEKIVDYIPIRVSGVPPYYWRENERPQGGYLDVKGELPAVYRKPTWTIPISGEYNVHVTYRHKVTLVPGTDRQPAYEVTTIDDTDMEFLDLLTGKFMQALGRNRKAFTLAELPLTSDADEMVSDGKEREERALEGIFENKKKWYLAWG